MHIGASSRSNPTTIRGSQPALRPTCANQLVSHSNRWAIANPIGADRSSVKTPNIT
jgi:hypothetical protein